MAVNKKGRNKKGNSDSAISQFIKGQMNADAYLKVTKQNVKGR